MNTDTFTLWKSGYKYSSAICVQKVSETDRAIHFSVMGSEKPYTFYLPKKAVSRNKDVEGILNIAGWFKLEGYISFLFDKYGSYYNR